MYVHRHLYLFVYCVYALPRACDRAGAHGHGRADLFAPFSSTKPLGLGLGLVICRDIVADYGGSIDFSPAPGSGATFIVRLPLWNG